MIPDGRAGDIITKKRNRLGVSAAPLLLFKSWMGPPEVQEWEIWQQIEKEEGVNGPCGGGETENSADEEV